MLVTMLERIQQGKGDATFSISARRYSTFNRGKGYCALINMPGPPIMSAIRLFRRDFEHHLQHGTCPN